VDEPARRVEIFRLELTSFERPVAVLHVECSKGTYIRSLAHDLGQALGCGAHLSGLIRSRVGGFEARNAVPLEQLEARFRQGTWRDVAVALPDALAHLPAVFLGTEDSRRLVNGQSVGALLPALDVGTLARACADNGDLLGIVRRGVRGDEPVWRPEKILGRVAAAGASGPRLGQGVDPSGTSEEGPRPAP
jgi:tRNA pseudouridine55 synthase